MSILHKPEKLLLDILNAAEAIQAFTAGMTYDDFAANELVASACERKFEIIGEALNRLSKSFPDYAKKFPDLSDIIAFRNIIIHGYDVVDPEILWDTIINNIPEIIAGVKAL